MRAVCLDVSSMLKSVIVTEKALVLKDSFAQYSCYVSRDADKGNIKMCLERIFGYEVSVVRTMNLYGKAKRFRGRLGGRCARKKAVFCFKDNAFNLDLEV